MSRFLTFLHLNKDDVSVVVGHQKQTQNIVGPSTYLIRADGFAWIATKQEIVNILGANNVLNGANGVHFIIDKVKNNRNEAFIQLVGDKQYQSVMNRKAIIMGYTKIKGE